MCGITGFTHRNKVPEPGRILDAVHSIVHRGPDEQDTFESPSISLGAVRLKIIDLQGGSQPMRNEDGSRVLVFNGEIYNHQELREQLTELGYRFHSKSDTEVVLRAFEHWDTGCLCRLRGMFAFAIWAEKENRLILARDRIGIKPLYFHRRDDDIYFGSELKTLFVHPEIPRNLDHTALEYFLYLNYVPCPFTLVKGIEKLPPAHFLEWRKGRTTQHCYWRNPMKPTANMRQEDALEQLDGLLLESTREHLQADVPVGLWLSGGLDSSTILHYASSIRSSPIKTFSISFAGRSFDERKYIQETVRHYGTDHEELDLNSSLDLAGAIEELSYYSDEPFADAGALPVWFLSAMTRRKATVALSGEGADELFGGYLTYRADKFADSLSRVPRFLRRGLRACAGFLPVSDEKIGFDYKLKRFLSGSLLPADEAHAFWNGSFSTAEQTWLLRHKNGTNVSRLYHEGMPAPSPGGSLNRFLSFDQSYYLPDDILQKVDRMSMAHSLEVRPPFLDHRLVEFTATLPENMKIRGGCQKYLLRELMRDKLPASVLARPKTGLDIPTHEWFRGPLKALLLDTLSESALLANGIFRPEAVRFFLKQHIDRQANCGFHLWGLLVLFLWMKQWNIQALPDLESGDCNHAFQSLERSASLQ